MKSKMFCKIIKILVLINLSLFIIVSIKQNSLNNFFDSSYLIVISPEQMSLCFILSLLIIIYLLLPKPSISTKNDNKEENQQVDDILLIQSIRKKRFPPKMRLEICKYLYEYIPRNSNTTLSQALILVKSTNVYQDWKLKLSHFEPYTESYIKDLIAIIIKIHHLNQNYNKDYDEDISIHRLSLEIYGQGINLGLSLPQFERILTELFDFLKVNFCNEFKVERVKKGKNKIFGNESLRISIYKKKFRLLFELKNPNCEFKIPGFTMDSFKGNCARKECKVDFSRLPAMEFHHLVSNVKEFTWNKIYSIKYSILKGMLEIDKTIPICRNCHEFFSKKLFSDFKDIILKEDMFFNKEGQIRTAEEIDTILNNLINFHPKYLDRAKILKQTKESIKFQIKGWLKKRAVIEQLFQGKCQGCNEMTVEGNLPALTFHHLNPNIKKSKWAELLPSLTISQLAKGIIEEGCTCLCANCHAIIESKYYLKNIAKIFYIKNEMGTQYIEDIEFHVRKAHLYVKKIKINLQNELNRIMNIEKIEIVDYLTKKYGYGNAWKKYLIAIYHKIDNKNINKIRPNEINLTNNRKYFKKLNEKGLIRLVEEKKGSFKIFKLTDKGFIEVEKIIQSWNNNIIIEKR